jgi:glycosyltransferase involved in cell wall biosynthesis
MKNILIISELEDYLNNLNHSHYSLNKGFEFAKGLSNIDNTNIFYFTIGETRTLDKINFVNEKNIDSNFIDNLNFFILIRETNLLEILKIKILEEIINNPKIIKFIKSDSIVWLNNKIYTKHFLRRHNLLTFIYNNFTKICCQTDTLKKNDIEYLISIFGKNSIKNISDKIFISRMGVPNINPCNFTLENPYDINHNYCVKDHNLLCSNKALCPLIINENFHSKKTILIYMGRIKYDHGKILYMLRDIMRILGDAYELHIFPGRFVLPDSDLKERSAKDRNNLKEMQENIFKDSTNVIIHFPFFSLNKTAFIQYADIALDFSPSRPKNKKYSAGNAKLLEYCYYGLKVVCEKNIGNSELVEIGKNGILLDSIASPQEYVNAIEKINNTNIDRNYTIEQTIKFNNWDLISKEFYDANLL